MINYNRKSREIALIRSGAVTEYKTNRIKRRLKLRLKGKLKTKTEKKKAIPRSKYAIRMSDFITSQMAKHTGPDAKIVVDMEKALQRLTDNNLRAMVTFIKVINSKIDKLQFDYARLEEKYFLS